MAKGLDCGTSFYIAATEDTVKKQRNAFLTVDGQVSQVKRMLKRQGIPFVEKAGKVHIVGQHAFNYAQIFSTSELKRPMKSGLLNPTEKDALPVLNAIIGELLGDAKEGETCVYCIPSKPIDVQREVSYHEDVLRTIIEQYGYSVKKIEEAVAIGYEGLVDTQLTGVAISMGAGMCNIAVMYQGMTALSFSVSRGGDWVDENVAMDTGVSQAKVTSIKETSTTLDLSSANYQNIYEEDTDEANVLIAIRSYYGALVNYLLTNLKVQFEGVENVPNFPNPVPIVIGGGTSLVKGFLDVFNEQFDQNEFPIPISEIIHIEDAHTAVARGCLSEAQLIEEDDEE
nr:MreB-like protein [uncultured Mediterranean phage uvMED]|tara:strand:- start:744 stop:1766 length:1023 start_codon:yes stop_codon:yes gene_type:complete